jgi:hypothetical protein
MYYVWWSSCIHVNMVFQSQLYLTLISNKMLGLLMYEAYIFTNCIHIFICTFHFTFASKRVHVPHQRAICIRSPCCQSDNHAVSQITVLSVRSQCSLYVPSCPFKLWTVSLISITVVMPDSYPLYSVSEMQTENLITCPPNRLSCKHVGRKEV